MNKSNEQSSKKIKLTVTEKLKQKGYEINANKLQKFKYLCVLDFEATCAKDRGSFKPIEIIEWPCIIIDTKTKGIRENIFHYYVKPTANPILTDFCTELTGITQSMVNDGISINACVNNWNKWCYNEGLLDEPSCIVTCGDWDLNVMWEKQYKQDVSLGTPALFHSWINIKHVFEFVYDIKARGMMGMLKEMNLEHVGRHHSGIDDCKNIANIVVTMLKNNVVFADYTMKHKKRDPNNDVLLRQNIMDNMDQKDDN